jgi:ketosteroid isomerase-like protein
MSQENADVFQEFIGRWQRNVDVLRLFTDAFNRRDLAALLSCCDRDIEIVTGGVLLGTPMYRGHREMERWFRDMAVAWEELQVEPHNLIAVSGNALVAVGEAVGRGRTAGVPFVVHDMATRLEFKDDKVVRCEFFTSEAEALEVGGVSE